MGFQKTLQDLKGLICPHEAYIQTQKPNEASVCQTRPVKTKQFIIQLCSKSHTFGAGHS